MISFAYDNVPYYHKLFNELRLTPSDIKTIEDLEKIPTLTKDTIKDNWEDFKPVDLDTMRYYTDSTGGSTGTPFRYRLLKYDRFLSGAMLYRGWGYADYELGDRMVFLAGSSLDVGTKSIVVNKAHEVSRNIRKLSAFDMGPKDMQQYANVINSFKPKFIRGYASSVNFFANFINENNVDIPTPQAVFTTAEKLMPHMRKNIEDRFGCEVYDAYGLNDGGVGAYECAEHNGLHIDTERSIMEIVDDDGRQLEEGIGRILATSLHNYAMPFIRYDTGDIGHLLNDECGCGRKSKLLKEVMGRTVDILLTPDGRHVHGYFLLYIFWEYGKGIKEYQVVQTKVDKLVIKIVTDDSFDEKQLDMIREIIKSKSNEWDVEFRFVDEIERTKAGKYKFIISELV
ncbi:phenylacetate--CoA ligase family protein [Methanococcoides alaskense]|uniref:Phenylacetate-CoA ligase n=1 Tax=Methanococcoides alaskense TaxID=325778 RepID=A0AA90TYS0_9EURY|nr:phenylacetate--CoA ligase family protein [Methanococcoides alaskense]MDA0524645.1 phenylacetate--CoA ligase family protein [Methanococcoides alaskense]MDR6222432.1 phenylacetate-CoA ligase [Methanococcoides alaskense]